jgi:hypothetical protein
MLSLPLRKIIAAYKTSSYPVFHHMLQHLGEEYETE